MIQNPPTPHTPITPNLLRTFTAILACLLVFAFLTACTTKTTHTSLSRHEFHRIIMGVDARIILYAHTADHATTAAAAAFDRLNQLNAICSDYLTSSELNTLIAAPHNSAHPISPDLFRVLSIAEELRAASNNSFDISLAPAITLWREARATKRLPTPDQLNDALARRAPILLDPIARTATLPKPHMRLDLGGIAKGYAAHQAVLTLRAHHTPNCLVALAGDISVGDAPPHDQPHEQPHQPPNEPNGWRIAIDHGTTNTSTDASTPPRALFLTNTCISTSGTNIQYIEVNGVRYAHLINPHTGLGSTTTTAITITGPEGAHTDALATALCLMNESDRAALLQRFPDYTLHP